METVKPYSHTDNYLYINTKYTKIEKIKIIVMVERYEKLNFNKKNTTKCITFECNVCKKFELLNKCLHITTKKTQLLENKKKSRTLIKSIHPAIYFFVSKKITKLILDKKNNSLNII